MLAELRRDEWVEIIFPFYMAIRWRNDSVGGYFGAGRKKKEGGNWKDEWVSSILTNVVEEGLLAEKMMYGSG